MLKNVWMHLNWVQSFVLTGGSDWERKKNELKDYVVWKLTWAKNIVIQSDLALLNFCALPKIAFVRMI